MYICILAYAQYIRIRTRYIYIFFCISVYIYRTALKNEQKRIDNIKFRIKETQEIEQERQAIGTETKLCMYIYVYIEHIIYTCCTCMHVCVWVDLCMYRV